MTDIDHAKRGELFKEALTGLYGEHWIRDAAEDLGLNERSVRRMADGKSRIPPGLWDDIQKMLLAEGNRLLALATTTPRADA